MFKIKNKLTLSIVIAGLVILLGLAGFWFWREQIFSKQILRLDILGSDTAKVGDEVEYTVRYKNNANFVLENAKLTFKLPDNSMTEDAKLRIVKDIEDIYPGDEKFVKFKAHLIGKEGDLKVAEAWLSYVPKNLSARYESNTTFTTKIESAPITLSFDLPSKVEKGKEVTYAINYFSNVDYPLENLSLKVDSVPGFTFASAEPSSLDNSEWKLPTLLKSQGGRITIKGAVVADTKSVLPFSARLGMWQDGNFIVIKETKQDVEVIDPLLFISQQVNGSTRYVATPGEKLHYQVFFRNIGGTSFNNLLVMYRFESSAFDLSTLTSNDGQLRASENMIVWDAKESSRLKHLDPEEEVSVEFDVALKNNWPISDAEKNNVLVKNKVTILDMSQEFTTKVNAKLDLIQKAYYSPQQGIENTGPLPPQVGASTSYTIYWQVKNYFNDVKNAKVRAVLPVGATVTSKISPSSQVSHFSFDSSSRQIVWSAGDLKAGEGALIWFQILVTPGAEDVGNKIKLVQEAFVSGEDQSTNKTVSTSVPLLNGDLLDDKGNANKGIVK